MILVPLRQNAKALDLGVLAAGIGAWAVGAAVAFRYVLMSSFDLIFGDRADGRMIIYLHEHLFNALQGRGQFLSPPIFYPQANGLGFTDAFLLDIPPYAVLRWLGLDPFLSFQVFAIALSLCGFLASLVVCTRYLRLPGCYAICAALLMTFPNNLVMKTAGAHVNFFALYYIPCIALLLLWGIEDFPRVTVGSLVRVAIGAAAFGLLFATAYYVAWMFALTVLIAFSVTAIRLRHVLTTLPRDHLRPTGAVIAAALFGFMLGIVPMILIYVPVLSIVPGRTFRDYIGFASFPKDLINVGAWNLLWGKLVGHLLGDTEYERALAVTPGMTVIFLALAYRLRRGATDPNNRAWQPFFFGVCAAVWAFSTLLTIKIGTFSLFWLPHNIIPGATAIRVGGRIQLISNLWVALGLAVLLQYWMNRATIFGRRPGMPWAAAILAFCILEQINLLRPQLSRGAEIARLDTVPTPPSECRAFLVSVPTQPADVIDENDAMWISWKVGLPTLNGSSGWSPPGWRLEDPAIDYLAAARQWIAQTGLTQPVCLYDRAGRHWSSFH